MFNYQTNLDEENATEETFQLTNESGLQQLVKTGDVIKIESIIRGASLPDYYLCKSTGWEKFKGDRIQLIRHLLW